MDFVMEKNIYEETLCSLYEQQRPSVLFKPQLTLDGNQYCALYGSDLMNGIAGFGSTADLAMRDFDKQWIESKAPTPRGETAHEVCSGCGGLLAHFAGPGKCAGRMCINPGCDLADVDLVEDDPNLEPNDPPGWEGGFADNH